MAIFSKKKTEQSETKVAVVEPKVEVAQTGAVKEATEVSMKDLYQADTTKKIIKEGSKKLEIKKAGRAYRVLVRPLITEKVSALGGLNKYVFEVEMKANKIEVAKAIMETYGVKPRAINIIKLEGKRVRRGRTSGQRQDWKKAIVTLPKGQSINVYEGV